MTKTSAFREAIEKRQENIGGDETLNARVSRLEAIVESLTAEARIDHAQIQGAAKPSSTLIADEKVFASFEIPNLGHLIVEVPAEGDRLSITWRAPNKQRATVDLLASMAGMSGTDLYKTALADPIPYRRRRR